MPEKFPHPLPLFSQKPHPPAPSPRGEGSKNMLISVLAPLPWERGWGEADLKERGWGEADLKERSRGEVDLSEELKE